VRGAQGQQRRPETRGAPSAQQRTGRPGRAPAAQHQATAAQHERASRVPVAQRRRAELETKDQQPATQLQGQPKENLHAQTWLQKSERLAHHPQEENPGQRMPWGW